MKKAALLHTAPTSSKTTAAAPKASLFVLWQSLVVSTYRSFFEHLTKTAGLRVALVAPRRFRELAQQDIECAPFKPPFKAEDPKYPYFILESWRPHVQIVIFQGLAQSLKRFFKRLDRLHESKVFLCIAEPYSLTAFWAWLVARFCLGKDFLFICYAAQNIYKDLAWPLKVIQNFLFPRSAAILVIGREQEEVLRRHGYPGLTMPFPLWFDSSRFSLQASDLPPLPSMGFAGGLTEAKGIRDFLACCEANLAAWKGKYAVRIAGSGVLKGEVKAHCERLHAQGLDIVFLGSLAAEDMPAFYGSIDILIVPSRTTEQWKEQFGRVIVEAQACGTLVLGSDSGEIPHVIKTKERIFPEGDLSAMSRTLASWLGKLSTPEARLELRREQAAKACESYSDIVLARRFAAELSKLSNI